MHPPRPCSLSVGSPETTEQRTFIDNWQEPHQNSLPQDHRFWTYLPITRSEDVNKRFIDANNIIATASRDGEWEVLFKQLEEFPELVNYPRILGTALYTPLHQAARNGASVQIVKLLLSLGAFKTLKNAKGETPLDTARRLKHNHLFSILEPRPLHAVSSHDLFRLTQHFQTLINARMQDYERTPKLRLPILDPLTELNVPILRCAIPSLNSDFNLKLTRSGHNPQIIMNSWFNDNEGSGQKHLIMPQGYVQLENGTL